MEVQEASEPLGGVFSLIVNGDGYNGQTDTLPHDANTDEVRKNTTINMYKCETRMAYIYCNC